VGRVVEIKRGGKIRLHWFKETRLMSGMYSGTNSYFVERASNLTPFISYAADKTTRTVALFPLVEVDDKLAASKKHSGALADPCNVVSLDPRSMLRMSPSVTHFHSLFSMPGSSF
jgi:hypothetical protein